METDCDLSPLGQPRTPPGLAHAWSGACHLLRNVLDLLGDRCNVSTFWDLCCEGRVRQGLQEFAIPCCQGPPLRLELVRLASLSDCRHDALDRPLVGQRVLDAHPLALVQRTERSSMSLLLRALGLRSGVPGRHGGLEVHELLVVHGQSWQLAALPPAEEYLRRAEAVGPRRVPERLNGRVDVLLRVLALHSGLG